MRAQVAQGVAYQRRYARSNDPVIAARGLWLHNIHKVTVPLCRGTVCVTVRLRYVHTSRVSARTALRLRTAARAAGSRDPDRSAVVRGVTTELALDPPRNERQYDAPGMENQD